MMKPYPEYKKSGVEWLGNVPKHWENVPVKYLATEEGSLFIDGDWIESKDLSEHGIRYITTGNVGLGKYKEQGSGFITEEKFSELNCTEVFPDDLIISRLNSPIGRACLVPDLKARIVTSVDNVILRPNEKYSKRFLVYLFSSNEYINNNENLARGATMQRISRGLLGNVRLLIPETLDEQEKIADYLDQKIIRVDTLINEKESFIKLLQEKRQSLISHVVTKGLDDNVKMKPSGVDWIGDIPEHWEIKPIKYLGLLGPSKSEISQDLTSKQCSFVPMEKLKTDTLILDEERDIKEVINGYTYFKEGDILFAKVTPCFENKNMCIAEGLTNGIGFGSSEINVFRTNKSNNTKFVYYLFQEEYFMQFAKSNMTGTGGLKRVPSDVVLDYKVAVPPLKEQIEIAEEISNRFARLALLIEETKNSIELLKEHRTALISAAVTGKIDVREAV